MRLTGFSYVGRIENLRDLVYYKLYGKDNFWFPFEVSDMVKNNIELDVKTKCIEQGKTQVNLAEEIETTKAYVNRVIKKQDEEIVKGEQLTHKKNQYGLSVVNGVVFHNDYFVFENKAYLYNILTNIIPVSFGDVMPGFARVISEQREVGNILLRLDDRLALPEEQAISYSTLNFEKYRGPQFHFKDTLLKTSKTISVHFNGKTMDKLLMVVKQKFDEKENKSFWHIELETLPYRNQESKGKYCITTFLHGMYYPDEDIFTHIDYTKNQYDIDTYLNKYSDCNEDMPIDTYTSSNELHYKIWCIEGGKYSRETWYRLMVVSLNQEYVELLDEILE